MLINKIVKGNNCEVTHKNEVTEYAYKIFSNLSFLAEFNSDKKSIKLSVKGRTFSRQVMYILFN